MTLLPSTLTTETPVTAEFQAPLGTYETTFVPVTSADSELDGWHEPAGIVVVVVEEVVVVGGRVVVVVAGA